MKVFFDTNVYIAEALLGDAAERMIDAVVAARWRIYASEYLWEELARVLVGGIGVQPTAGHVGAAADYSPQHARRRPGDGSGA